jgi:hypothetical protein
MVTNIIQDPNTPRFDTKTGNPTDYGISLGLTKPAPSPITLDQLKPQPQVTIPDPKIQTPPSPVTLTPLQEYIKTKEDKSTKETFDYEQLLADAGLKSQREQTLREEYKAPEQLTAYTDFSNQLAQEQRTLDTTIRDIERNNPGGTFGGAMKSNIDNLKRESLQKQADIAILSNAALNNYNAALKNAKDKVDLEFKPLDDKLAYKKEVADAYKDQLTKAEYLKVQSLFNQEETKLAEDRKVRETIENIKVEAAKNGLTSFSGFDKVKTVNEALNLASKWLQTPNTDIVQLDNGSTVVVDKRTGKIINNLGGAKSTTSGLTGTAGNFSSIISRTAALEGTVAGKDQIKTDLTNYLNKQDYVGAYNQIENTVMNGLTGTTKTRFADARTDAQVLSGLKDKIQEFQDAGGDTGLLKGTAEQITRKLGAVKNPKLASLAVALQREFQSYRLNMTGAAFSPKESREYASVNPKTTNNFDLNMAVIDGAIGQLNNRVDSTVDGIITGAGDVRKLARIPEQNAKEVKSNPFLQVSQSFNQVFNNNTGWVIPGKTN